jgi:hypothetical protein
MSKLETFIEFQEDWSQLLGGCNWYTFRFCLFEFEWDKMMGGVEATIVIFGLGLRVRHNYAETKYSAEIKREVERIEAQLSPQEGTSKGGDK